MLCDGGSEWTVTLSKRLIGGFQYDRTESKPFRDGHRVLCHVLLLFLGFSCGHLSLGWCWVVTSRMLPLPLVISVLSKTCLLAHIPGLYKLIILFEKVALGPDVDATVAITTITVTIHKGRARFIAACRSRGSHSSYHLCYMLSNERACFSDLDMLLVSVTAIIRHGFSLPYGPFVFRRRTSVYWKSLSVLSRCPECRFSSDRA